MGHFIDDFVSDEDAERFNKATKEEKAKAELEKKNKDNKNKSNPIVDKKDMKDKVIADSIKEPIVDKKNNDKNNDMAPIGGREFEIKANKEKEFKENKGNVMADENTTKLETKIAKLEAKLANDEKAKYDKFLESLAQKVDNVCTEVGGCRKDIGDLKSKIDKDKEKIEKDSKETCVGLDCIKKDLKAGQEKLSRLDKLDKLDKMDISKLDKMDKLDRFELFDCPECNKKIVPLYPEPSNYCPHCGKPAQWLDDDGKPLKGWNPPWKK